MHCSFVHLHHLIFVRFVSYCSCWICSCVSGLLLESFPLARLVETRVGYLQFKQSMRISRFTSSSCCVRNNLTCVSCFLLRDWVCFCQFFFFWSKIFTTLKLAKLLSVVREIVFFALLLHLSCNYYLFQSFILSLFKLLSKVSNVVCACACLYIYYIYILYN